jgi:hypothetical protein
MAMKLYSDPQPWEPKDDLDDLLRQYFRSQVPQSWPECTPPVARRKVPRSRFVLAASIVVVAVGLYFASNLCRSPAPEERLDPNAATAKVRSVSMPPVQKPPLPDVPNLRTNSPR